MGFQFELKNNFVTHRGATESASQVLFISCQNGLKKYILICLGNKVLLKREQKQFLICILCDKLWY